MARSSRIWLDITPCSIVIVCNDCDHWRGFALNRDDAWQRAQAHEDLCHPGADQAADAVAKRASRARHAAVAV
ncbi:hypothetical protein [uncultured Microbacterium sp.]|uniref:hypothetical protein n=1 Tax=uncultured Microbacterium sp. TaxID=191216 RepID=UPI0025FDC7D0|nr:hypothetical protein [uncultured Microbacterium sp.]